MKLKKKHKLNKKKTKLLEGEIGGKKMYSIKKEQK